MPLYILKGGEIKLLKHRVNVTPQKTRRWLWENAKLAHLSWKTSPALLKTASFQGERAIFSYKNTKKEHSKAK